MHASLALMKPSVPTRQKRPAADTSASPALAGVSAHAGPVSRLAALQQQGNQSDATTRASTMQRLADANLAPVQRMALPLDDVQALANSGAELTPEKVASARIMTEAVGNRVRATDEAVARPHQVADDTHAGALSTIGLTEELRIFGHGQTTTMSGNVAVQIAGYTPGQLANLLIRMGLPAEYAGEIYLSGCLTAVGPNHGFLGRFHAAIAGHAPGCIVRGNLGNAITYEDGTQGVWSGIVSKETYQAQRKLFVDQNKAIGAANKTAIADHKAGLITLDERNRIIAENNMLCTSLYASLEQFERQVYDTTGGFTVTLPSGSRQSANAIRSVVSGAISSPSDVDAVLGRIGGDLQAALDEIDAVLAEGPDIKELIAKTEELAMTSFKFFRS